MFPFSGQAAKDPWNLTCLSLRGSLAYPFWPCSAGVGQPPGQGAIAYFPYMCGGLFWHLPYHSRGQCPAPGSFPSSPFLPTIVWSQGSVRPGVRSPWYVSERPWVVTDFQWTQFPQSCREEAGSSSFWNLPASGVNSNQPTWQVRGEAGGGGGFSIPLDVGPPSPHVEKLQF